MYSVSNIYIQFLIMFHNSVKICLPNNMTVPLIPYDLCDYISRNSCRHHAVQLFKTPTELHRWH